MGDHNPSVPKRLSVTCIECHGQQMFEVYHAERDEYRAFYRCPECGHVVTLDLDPQ